MTALSAEDLERFRRDGFVSQLALLTPEEAADCRAKLEAFEADFGDRAAEILRQKSHVVLTWVDGLVRHPRILDTVEAVLGPDILCWSSSFFIKNARDPRFVSWHQDSIYWGLDTDAGTVSMWIALTPATVANGCMRILPGSHHKRLEHRQTDDPNNFLTHGQTLDVDESRAVDIVLAPGECCLFDVLVAHGSNPNPSDERRIGLAVRYIRPSLRQVRDTSDSAMLVRGKDRFGHFAPEPRPTADAAPEALAFHAKLMGSRDGGVYEKRRTDWRPR